MTNRNVEEPTVPKKDRDEPHDVPRPVQSRRGGGRRNAGADTPSGPNTERTTVRAELENAGKSPSDILPSTPPEMVKEIKKQRQGN